MLLGLRLGLDLVSGWLMIMRAYLQGCPKK